MLKQTNSNFNYDLYGIINHYGTLTAGHYISIVKSLKTNEWYQYDDQKRTPISEQDVIEMEHAYILFYIRKDVAEKEDM